MQQFDHLSEGIIPRAAPSRVWWVKHGIMMWLVDSFIAPLSQVGVDAIFHLCIIARKRLTPILSVLSLTQVGLRSVILMD